MNQTRTMSRHAFHGIINTWTAGLTYDSPNLVEEIFDEVDADCDGLLYVCSELMWCSRPGFSGIAAAGQVSLILALLLLAKYRLILLKGMCGSGESFGEGFFWGGGLCVFFGFFFSICLGE